jgi:OOP family OmpA-OmpF porin
MAKKDNSYDMDDSSSSKKSIGMGKIIGFIIAVVLILSGVFFFQKSGKQADTAIAVGQKESVKSAQETVTSQAAPGQQSSPSNSGIEQTQGNAIRPIKEATKESAKSAQVALPQDVPAAQSAIAAKAEPEKLTIHFGFDKSSINANELSMLKSFWTKIKGDKGTVRIAGYTDNIGSVGYNKALSKKRAESVSNELREYGLDKGYNLSFEGLGDIDQVADNSTKEGRAKNRRAEIYFSR